MSGWKTGPRRWGNELARSDSAAGLQHARHSSVPPGVKRIRSGIVTVNWPIVTRTFRTFTTGTDIKGGLLQRLEDPDFGLLSSASWHG
jgi:hypothetical protein